MLDGITVVVSPLISLMKDQVDGLRDQGIEAVSLINSALTWEEYQGELARAEAKRNKTPLHLTGASSESAVFRHSQCIPLSLCL